jgi:hypothetical protein
MASPLQDPQTMVPQLARKPGVPAEEPVREGRPSERGTGRRPSAPVISPPGDAGHAGEPLDRFDTLQSTLTFRALRLETIADELQGTSTRAFLLGYVRTACTVGELLKRVLLAAPLSVQALEVPLVQALRWAYLWAIEQVESVDGMLSGRPEAGYPNTIPREALSIFHETARRMARSKSRESHAPTARETLFALDDALFRMMQMHDWIAEVAGGRTAGVISSAAE